MLNLRIVGHGYIQRDQHGRNKMGWSLNPATRLGKLQTGNGDKLELIAVIPGITLSDEQRLHKALRGCRVAPKDPQRREWFWNGRKFWSIVKQFVKDQRTALWIIEPQQGDLFRDDGDSSAGQLVS